MGARIQVNFWTLSPIPRGRALDIVLEYRLRRAERTDQLAFSINLAEEGN